MAHPDDRINILLIVTDQQRYDTLGCYGRTTCRTPNIDGIARRGVRFDATYTATSPCSASRAALFTGLYPHKNHVLANGGVLNLKVPNLATELCAARYNLGYAVKWHVDQEKVPSKYGFEGKDFPGYGYPPGGSVIEGLRFGKPARDSAIEWCDEQGLLSKDDPNMVFFRNYYDRAPVVRVTLPPELNKLIGKFQQEVLYPNYEAALLGTLSAEEAFGNMVEGAKMLKE